MDITNVKSITIGNRRIGPGHPPFIIAELSGNHDGSLNKAISIVEAAAEAGADALKLQTYTAHSMTLDISKNEFMIDDPASLWHGHSLYQLYEKASTPRQWHEPIYQRCRELGLIAFSSPFDEDAVDFLESIGTPCYKIASFENNHIPLIRKAAATGKPLIISTGMASEEDLQESIKEARQGGCRDLVLLKCTSSYPALPQEANLHTIPHMANRFNCPCGLSDHSLNMGVSIAAVALGATVIEKHFTLSRQDGGVDAAFSLEPFEMKNLVEASRAAYEALGEVHYGPTPGEKLSINHRRSVYIIRDMKAGEVFTTENIQIIRPGLGLPPLFYQKILGKKITRNTPRGTPLSRELLEQGDRSLVPE